MHRSAAVHATGSKRAMARRLRLDAPAAIGHCRDTLSGRRGENGTATVCNRLCTYLWGICFLTPRVLSLISARGSCGYDYDNHVHLARDHYHDHVWPLLDGTFVHIYFWFANKYFRTWEQKQNNRSKSTRVRQPTFIIFIQSTQIPISKLHPVCTHVTNSNIILEHMPW